jgi:alkanesulfonate monooxygenase SsuD/methylene tetrahydromethanopterin reductase-like flavin-dependent oxidoreductase (luciferase family)
MRFGAHYLTTYVPELDGPPAEFYRHIFEQTRELDALGYDDVWVTEHHYHEYGGTVPDPATFLSAVAAQTSRIHLGIAIVILPLHHPLPLAESYAMVDVISNGRLEFGIGRGNAPELEAFKVPIEEGPIRFRETWEVIEQAWSAGCVEFHGQIYDVNEVRVLPSPVQRPHPPVWVAANRSDDTFRWAGTKGFHLMTLPYSHDPVVLGEQIDFYREARAAAGHDPASAEILGKFHIYVADSDAAAESEAADYLNNYYRVADAKGATDRVRPSRVEFRQQLAAGTVIAGDPARCIDHIHKWKELLGLTTISGTFHFGGMPQELALKNIRTFAEKVMPAFSRTPATSVAR